MSRNFQVAVLFVFIAVIMVAAPAFASEAAGGEGRYASFYSFVALASVIGLGLAAGGCGIGMGNAVAGAVGAMARNPGFYDKIFLNMMIGLALIESCIIYTLIIALVLLFANPL